MAMKVHQIHYEQIDTICGLIECCTCSLKIIDNITEGCQFDAICSIRKNFFHPF